jgi:peptidoglycan hydrolase-like protein with peptidoglycan-binding domain
MNHELNFEAEAFDGYEAELEGYEGAELEGYEAEFEFEDSQHDALDLNNPSVVRSLHGALSRATGVNLPRLGRLAPQATGLLRHFQKQHGIKPNGVVGPNTVNALRRHIASVTQGEAADYEMEGEVSRSSSAYIRWVQESLNKIQRSGLAVDGVKGPLTTAAVKQFQQSRGLTVDGIVGPITEAALVSAGASPPPQTGAGAPSSVGKINSQLPASGTGFYSYAPASRRYGIPETIRALQQISAAWAAAHPTGPRVGFGDISKQGGGPISGHKSHQNGVDVDIRLMRKDGKEEPTVYQASNYSRPLTQELINLIRANGVLRVQYIFFNDPQARGVSKWPNHDNHLHVRFYAP